MLALARVAGAGAVSTPTPTVTPTPTIECTDPTPGNPCIPGGGTKKSDCSMEWIVTPMPTLTRGGVPKNRSICYEGDRLCDVDADLGNHRCAFSPKLCLNNADPRQTGCVPSDVATFEVKAPKSTSADTNDVANLGALEGLAGPGGFGLTVQRKKTPIAAGTANATPNACASPVALVAPLHVSTGGALKKHTTSIKIAGTTSSGTTDTDTLKLECRPSTCGDGIVDMDHEECDDGNRSNGDGCDQGCRVGRFGVHASLGQRPGTVAAVNDLGAQWVRINLALDGNAANDIDFNPFLAAGINVVITLNNRNPANIDLTYSGAANAGQALAAWPNAGFPYVSKDQYQQDIRDTLARINGVDSGRVWLQCENEVGDASLSPDSRYWRGTNDQYLTQLASFYDGVRSASSVVPVIASSFASENLDAVINPSDPHSSYQIDRLSTLLSTGKYDAADLHFYGCVNDIPAKVQWVRDHLPAGKRWISTENSGPDSRCAGTPISWTQNLALFEQIEAAQVSARLGACVANGGSICLWFSLSDLQNETDVFNHLGLLDQSVMPSRQKPAYDAFKTFVATNP